MNPFVLNTKNTFLNAIGKKCLIYAIVLKENVYQICHINMHLLYAKMKKENIPIRILVEK